MPEFTPNRASLVLKINSIFGRQHIINALKAFAENLQSGVISSGEGKSDGYGLYEEYKYEEDYTCKDATRDIDFYFSEPEKPNDPEKEEALNRALYRHMTLGSMPQKHNVSCQKCWNYYQHMKR